MSLFVPPTHSSDVILITYKNRYETSLLTKRILLRDYRIPDKLIRIKQSRCQHQEAAFHICVEDNGNIKLGHKPMSEVLHSFKVFFPNEEPEL